MTSLRLPPPGPTDGASEVRVFDRHGVLLALVDPVSRVRTPVSEAMRLSLAYARVLAGCRREGLTPLQAAQLASLEQRLAAVVPMGRRRWE